MFNFYLGSPKVETRHTLSLQPLAILLSLFISITNSVSYASSTTQPPLTLAKTYQDNIDLKQYWVSEKLDGVRAYWNGHQLISRQGNPFPAPAWFTKEFPAKALDGELWLGRQQFQALLSIVKKKQAIDKEWKTVRYFVFDLPHSNKPFDHRLKELKKTISLSNSPYLKAVKQYQLNDKSALLKELDNITATEGEGLMLHKADSYYQVGRNNNLLKVKPYYDAEATVINHIGGKGKYTGLLGSLVVETTEGMQFKIGSGFSDQQRRKPPKIGDIITYKYYGKTLRGIPRFASFLRIRKQKN